MSKYEKLDLILSTLSLIATVALSLINQCGQETNANQTILYQSGFLNLMINIITK